jgi:DNA mismatch endonuclease (patch repair protein)
MSFKGVECAGSAMDIWSKAKRSEVMSRIRSRDTKPEFLVRSLLHRAGLRYSLKRKELPGRPDIVLPKYKIAVFVHGCFWHRHKGCPVATNPKTRKAFWQEKFKGNVTRDRRTRKLLEKLGWKVLVVWECDVMRDPHEVLFLLLGQIGVKSRLVYDDIPEKKVLLQMAEKKVQRDLEQCLFSQQ